MQKKKLTGKESFTFQGQNAPESVHDFWAWALSRLLMDGPRGDLAEYIVRLALGEDTATPKRGWGECDIVCRDGRKIEVKCSSYLQEWERDKPSWPVFSIAKTASCDIAEVNGCYRYIGRDGQPPKRHSDAYIFCLFACAESDAAEPLDLGQWHFYLMRTADINARFGDQRSVSIPALEKANAVSCGFGELRKELDKLLPPKGDEL